MTLEARCVVLAAMLLGCGSEGSARPDASAGADAGTDAGTSDAGSDAAVRDAGIDAATVDADTGRVTRIVVRYAGIPGAIALRGSGGGLSWDTDTPMVATGDDTFTVGAGRGPR